MNEALAAACMPLFQKDELKMGCSMLEGCTPCHVFADDITCPTAAIVCAARFGLAFAAGDARKAPDLLKRMEGLHADVEIVATDDAWHAAFFAYSKKSVTRGRYLFAPPLLEDSVLQTLAAPPEGTTLCLADAHLLRLAQAETWSEDLLGLSPDAETFLKNGFGILLLRDGQLLAGCSTFMMHADGPEIQIDTHPDHRKQGYATCVGAAFILEARRRGLTPHWDAANHVSARLAQKLGYRLQKAYIAWVLIP